MASKHIYELGGRRFESFRAHQCTFSGTYEPRQRGALLFLPSGFSPPTASEVVRPIHGPNPRFARARLRRSEFVPDEFVESFRAHQCTFSGTYQPRQRGALLFFAFRILTSDCVGGCAASYPYWGSIFPPRELKRPYLAPRNPA